MMGDGTEPDEAAVQAAKSVDELSQKIQWINRVVDRSTDLLLAVLIYHNGNRGPEDFEKWRAYVGPGPITSTALCDAIREFFDEMRRP